MLVRILNHVYKRDFGSVCKSASQHVGKRLNIAGIYPPIATPFTQKGTLDYQSLDQNVQKYGKMPFRGKHINFAFLVGPIKAYLISCKSD